MFNLRQKNMGYIHNYELPSKAEELIQQAYADVQEPKVKKLVGEALDILRKYLNQDNVVISDAADSYVKASSTFDYDQKNLIRDTFAEILWYPEQGNRFIIESKEDALDIINTCQRIDHNPQFESIEVFCKNTAMKWSDEPVMPEEEEEEE